jgi:hypothetical protein
MNDRPSLPDEFLLRRWHDPVVESSGFRTNSVYAETVLLPIIGPSSLLCLRRLGAWAEANPGGVSVDSRRLSQDLGLATSTGRHSPINRTLNRLCYFNLGAWSPFNQEFSIRTAVPPLQQHHLRRLSPAVLSVHYSLIREAETRRRSTSRAVIPDPPEPARRGLGVRL